MEKRNHLNVSASSFTTTTFLELLKRPDAHQSLFTIIAFTVLSYLPPKESLF